MHNKLYWHENRLVRTTMYVGGLSAAVVAPASSQTVGHACVTSETPQCAQTVSNATVVSAASGMSSQEQGPAKRHAAKERGGSRWELLCSQCHLRRVHMEVGLDVFIRQIHEVSGHQEPSQPSHCSTALQLF